MKSIDDYINEASDDFDYDDYDGQLAAEIDKRIQNNQWLSNPKQRYYVVKSTEYTLARSQPPDITERRSEAQKEVLRESNVEDIQTIQDACHRKLFDGYEAPPKKYTKAQWHRLFEQVIESIETERRSRHNR
jgi:hypothetical protein